MMFYATISPENLPNPGDPDRRQLGRAHWRDKIARTPPSENADFANKALDTPQISALLDAIFDHSPFLTACLTADLAFAARLLQDGPDLAYEIMMEGLEEIASTTNGLDEFMATLRRAKRQAALTIALADITGHWPLEGVTRRLSRFADLCLRAAVNYLLSDAAKKGTLTLIDEENPATGSGFVVLAMGKLGANELNYSSDIDLILLYDHEQIRTPSPDKLQQTMVRMARNLVKILDQRTADGYVFRTDLRLRPDPGSTPLAMSVLAAETYYESQGQNWERAAMIKARPAAGDLAVGAAFLESLRPFIWRKHLDFAALADIQSIKRQIEATRGGADIAAPDHLEGHNIKLGRGGIREIEFFAQTQQLIWGGRSAEARSPRTLDALETLTQMGRISTETSNEMKTAYRFLRQVEHRLQMIDDRQTQTLPKDAVGIAALAAFLGMGEASFRTRLATHMRIVADHYGGLFEHSAPLGAGGALAFTGEDHHPDTLQTLKELGFREPETASTIVRNWHRGRYNAMRSTRARELLTELTPPLLTAIAKGIAPDQGLRHFDMFLEGLPAGVQLFSMLQANSSLLDLVTEIMGAAPKLAQTLSRNPLLLDGVLSGDFHDHPPGRGEMEAELEERLIQARDTEDLLTLSRRWANDAKFQIGVQYLGKYIDIIEAGAALSDVAETAVAALAPRIAQEFSKAHGHLPHGEFGILALGKLGGREMTESSDLDLIFLYDISGDSPDGQSDGPKPLGPSVYFQRYGQRIVTALTAPLGDGRLYEVDLRLRPSGKAGPIAVSTHSFEKYQKENAWIWEHMALTRARVIFGSPDLTAKLEKTIRDILCIPRDKAVIAAAVNEMRERIGAEHDTANPWSIKHVRGGLIDCEFIAQFLQLVHAHDNPDIISGSSIDVFAKVGRAGIISTDAQTELVEAVLLWRQLQAMLRLCLSGSPANDEAIPEALQTKLTEATGAKSFADLEVRMVKTRNQVIGHFTSLIG